MNRFIIVDGLPYLYANGKAYKVRWDELGFTVGAEVELASAPTITYSELSIKAKCANNLDSIKDKEPEQGTAPEDNKEPEQGTALEDNKEPAQDNSTDDDTSNETPQNEIKLEDMKLDELKTYAKEKGIDLKGVTRKADIIDVIKAHEENKTANE